MKNFKIFTIAAFVWTVFVSAAFAADDAGDISKIIAGRPGDRSAQYSISAWLKDGRVYFKGESEYMTSEECLGGKTYEVRGVAGKPSGIFAGNIGGGVDPVICILTEGGGVEVCEIFRYMDGKDFRSGGPVPGLKNIVNFTHGTEYADEKSGGLYYTFSDDPAREGDIFYDAGGNRVADPSSLEIVFSLGFVYAFDKDGKFFDIAKMIRE
jgi:hypothetical protein